MNIPGTEDLSLIDNHTFSYILSAAMLTGIKLDIFTQLDNNPKSADALAKIINVNKEKLVLLLFILVKAGLLAVQQDIFSNTNEAQKYLVREKPDYKGNMISMMLGAIQKSDESIRSGIPQSKFNFNVFPEDILFKIFQEMHPGLLESGKRLMEKVEFNKYKHLLDIAAGSGGLSITACQEYPNLEASVVELSNIVPVTKKFISASGVSDRIKVIECDIIEDYPKGKYDIAVMHYFIQVISPEMAQKSLKNVFKALEPGGTLLIVGKVLDNTRIFPLQSVLFNLLFLNLYDDGQAYTEEEYTKWLSDAQFIDIKINNNLPPIGDALITAVKPHQKGVKTVCNMQRS